MVIRHCHSCTFTECYFIFSHLFVLRGKKDAVPFLHRVEKELSSLQVWNERVSLEFVLYCTVMYCNVLSTVQYWMCPILVLVECNSL